ncbi:MAG: hypothetical protein AAFR17_18515 [Pseudomonadota bacterium]
MQNAFLKLATAALILAAAPVAAETYVNGQRLTAEQKQWLAAYSCGPVWDGHYWLNMATGQWGFAGNPFPMGHIRDRCGQRRPSLSERGMLFRPGEILNGR